MRQAGIADLRIQNFAYTRRTWRSIIEHRLFIGQLSTRVCDTVDYTPGSLKQLLG